jgi:hypothetical protein
MFPVLRCEPWNRQAFPDGVWKVTSNRLVVSWKDKAFSAVPPGAIIGNSPEDEDMLSVERFRIVMFTVVALVVMVYSVKGMAVSDARLFKRVFMESVPFKQIYSAEGIKRCKNSFAIYSGELDIC